MFRLLVLFAVLVFLVAVWPITVVVATVVGAFVYAYWPYLLAVALMLLMIVVSMRDPKRPA